MKFCSYCAGNIVKTIPDHDDRMRHVCQSCRMIHYENPKMVVGCIPLWEDRILLCKRAIEPRHGKWTLPAGFLEKGETVSEGAQRETFEEAHARVTDMEPYALFNLPFVSQVYLMFRCRLADLDFSPGPESLEVQLFEESEIPWEKLAFTVMEETLRRFFEDRKKGSFPFRTGDISPT